MRHAAALVALLAFAAPSRAANDTLAQNFLQKYDSYQTAIKDKQSDLTKTGSPKVSLDPSIIDGFDRKLKRALKKAKCEGESEESKPDCAKATPDSIQEGMDALDQLADDWKEAVAKDAGKTLSALFADQIKALQTELKAAKIDSTDEEKLNTRITNFQNSLKGDGAKVAIGIDARKPETYAQYSRTFKQLSNDVKAAVALGKADAAPGQTSGPTGTFLSDFQSQWQKLLMQIESSKLGDDFKAQFKQEVGQIKLGKDCPELGTLGQEKNVNLTSLFGAAKSSAAGFEERAAMGKTGQKKACKPTDSDVEAATRALDKVSSEMTAALAKGGEGTETVYQIYENQLNALQKQLTAAKLDSTDQSTFQKRLTAMTSAFQSGKQAKTVTAKAPIAGMTMDMKRTAQAEITPDEAASEIAQFTKDLNAAIQLQGGTTGGSQTDAQKFLADIQALVKTINASKLDGPFKDALVKQADQAQKDGCNPNAATGKKERNAELTSLQKGPDTCAKATPDSLAAGETALQQVNAAFLAAQKTDGSKTLSVMYQPQLDALSKALAASTVDATDKKKLETDITNFQTELTSTEKADDSKTGAGATIAAKGKTLKLLTPDEAQKRFETIQSNVEAAIQLTTQKTTPSSAQGLN